MSGPAYGRGIMSLRGLKAEAIQRLWIAAPPLAAREDEKNVWPGWCTPLGPEDKGKDITSEANVIPTFPPRASVTLDPTSLGAGPSINVL